MGVVSEWRAGVKRSGDVSSASRCRFQEVTKSHTQEVLPQCTYIIWFVTYNIYIYIYVHTYNQNISKFQSFIPGIWKWAIPWWKEHVELDIIMKLQVPLVFRGLKMFRTWCICTLSTPLPKCSSPLVILSHLIWTCWFQKNTSSHNHQSGKWVPQLWVSFLFRVMFRFRDHGRKGKYFPYWNNRATKTTRWS